MVTGRPQLHNILAFFPMLEGNAAKVTWAHATNSREKLKLAIDGGAAMVLEADVQLSASTQQPVMAHPPDTESDLDLRTFLETTIEAGGRRPLGVKLDFKSTPAVRPSLRILAEVGSDRLAGPLILNADVLMGPGASEASPSPLDGARFLADCRALAPAALLSVGWVTSSGGVGGYSWQHVRRMRRLLLLAGAGRQQVAFPVRACQLLPAQSLQPLAWLCEATGGSVTVWAAAADAPLAAERLAEFVLAIGRGRVFVDLPHDYFGSEFNE